MTTEDLPGGSAPGTVHPAGVVPQPPTVREDDLAALRQPEFPLAMRGYDRAAVDAYVARVTQAIADLQVGRSPQSAIRHALDQVSEETRSILQRAHDTADEITSRSQAQAAERLARAEQEARAAIEAAETRVRVLDADADDVWRERKRLIDDVNRVSAELAELADAAGRRFPAETAESSADTVAIETEVEPEDEAEPDEAIEATPAEDLETAESAVRPPSPPPEESQLQDADGRSRGGAAA